MATYKDKTDYACKIVSQGFSEAKTANKDTGKKTPCFVLLVKPVGEIDKNDPDGQQYECPEYEREVKLWLTDNTVERAIANLRKLGWEGSKFSDLDPKNSGHFSFVGVEAVFSCKVKPSEDGTKSYDNFDFPYEGGPREVANDASVAAKLDNLFKKQLGACKPAPTKVKQTVPADDGQGPPDEDIPF